MYNLFGAIKGAVDGGNQTNSECATPTLFTNFEIDVIPWTPIRSVIVFSLANLNSLFASLGAQILKFSGLGALGAPHHLRPSTLIVCVSVCPIKSAFSLSIDNVVQRG